MFSGADPNCGTKKEYAKTRELLATMATNHPLLLLVFATVLKTVFLSVFFQVFYKFGMNFEPLKKIISADWDIIFSNNSTILAKALWSFYAGGDAEGSSDVGVLLNQ